MPEYEGLYRVSNLGRIERNGKVLRPGHDQAGYLTLKLSRNGRKTRKRVHVLVARAFLPRPREQERDVRHLNHDKTDCRVANLALGTRAENIADGMRDGRNPRGERHGHAKLTEHQVREIRTSTASEEQLAKKYKVDRRTIGMILKHVTWRHLP